MPPHNPPPPDSRTLYSPAASEAPAPAPVPTDVRMSQSGKVGFRLFDPGRVTFNHIEEAETVKISRSRKHERFMSRLIKPVGQFAMGSLCVLLGTVLLRRIDPQAPLAAHPIEYLPPGISEEVEAARGALLSYFSAGSVEEKLPCILPGVTVAQMKAYFAGGGDDLVLTRENILFSEKHSERSRHWYSFTLTPPGTLQEIRTYVSMAGARPLLHWQSYIQEKDGFAARFAGGSRPGVHDLRVGACRAASLEGKPRVVLVGLDGSTLCYAELKVDNAAEIQARLDYKKPASVTVQLTILPDGSKQVSRWKAWGLDIGKPVAPPAGELGTTVAQAGH